MPLLVFLWCIGWSVYWIGSKTETTKQNPKLSVKKELIIFVSTPKEKVNNLT
jgi:hypothetical protein